MNYSKRLLQHRKQKKLHTCANQLIEPINTDINKKKILCWSDYCRSTTGFGVVSRHILDALYATGRYEIDQLAINFNNKFEKVPYGIVPAKLGNPSDAYGQQMFIDAIKNSQYDIILIINDTFVVEKTATLLHQVHDLKQQHNHKQFKIVYYYPVDCQLLPKYLSILKNADVTVAYTYFAKEKSQAVGITPDHVIYHGTDTNTFYPLSIQERTVFRKKIFKITDPETFIWGSVNRNSLRKDIPRTLLAFKEFRKLVPNSILFLHTQIIDGTGRGRIDLTIPLHELALELGKDVLIPAQYRTGMGVSEKELNILFNCCDGFITTNLGEGWGLNNCNAMAAGVPVVSPNHTVSPEIFGTDRAYLIPCNDQVFIDLSGFRKFCHIQDIVNTMMECYSDWIEEKPKRKEMIQKARHWVKQHTWKHVCKQWIELFDNIDSVPLKFQHQIISGEEI